MKRLVVIVAAITALVILAAGAFLALFDADKYRPQIESQLSKALNRDVKIGKVGLRIYPLSVKITDLTIAEAPGFQQGTPFASAQQVFANADLFALIAGKPQVDSLQLDQPHIQLVRDVTGKWNFTNLGAKSGGASSSSQPLSLGELAINDGVVTVIDLKQSSTGSVYDHIDVKLKDFRADKQFPVSISAHLPGKGTETMSLNAKVGPLNSASPALTPVDGQFDVKSVSLSDLSGISQSGGKNDVDGMFTGQGTVHLQSGTLASAGNLAFDHLTTHGVSIGFPIRIDFKLGGDLAKDLFQLNAVDVQLDKTHFQITGVVDASRAPNEINLDVKAPPTSIVELARLAGAFGASTGVQATGTLALNVNIHGSTNTPAYLGSATLTHADLKVDALTKPIAIREAAITFQNDAASVQGLDLSVGSTTVKGKFSAKNFKAPNIAFDLSADKIDVAELQNLSKAPKTSQTKQDSLLNKITGAGTLDAGTVATSGLVITQVHAGVTLERGLIRFSPANASLFGGKQTGSVVADLRTSSPAFTVQSTLTGVDANSLLTEVSAAKNTLSGTLNAKTDVQFTIPPDGNLMKNLNGTLGFSLANGQIKNIDLVSELGKIAKFTGAPPPTGNATPIKRLSADLRFTNGIANTSDLVAEIPQGSISGTGTINLVNQALDMKVNAILASGPSKSFGGQSVGGFMTTVLANKNGELVIPAIVKGTTAKPIIEPDIAALARMRLSNLLPTSGNPTALTSGLLGLLDNSKGGTGSKVEGILGAITGSQTPQQNPSQSKTENAIGGFLKSLSKKKTDQ